MVLYQFFPYDSLKGLGGKLMFSTVLIFACYSPLGGTDWSLSLSLQIFFGISSWRLELFVSRIKLRTSRFGPDPWSSSKSEANQGIKKTTTSARQWFYRNAIFKRSHLFLFLIKLIFFKKDLKLISSWSGRDTLRLNFRFFWLATNFHSTVCCDGRHSVLSSFCIV